MAKLPLLPNRLYLRLFLATIAALLASSRGGARMAGHAFAEPRPVVVGYFPQWGMYGSPPYYVKTLVTSGGAAHLDQMDYSQGAVHDGHCSLADPNADLRAAYTSETSVDGTADDPASPFHGYFHQLQELKRRYPRLKILISLEGKASDFAADAEPQNRQAFVASCVDLFVRGHFAPGIEQPGIFDGFDVDWESPQQADAANFIALLEEFRAQMKAVRPGLRLSVAVGQSPHMLPGTDFASVARIVDQVGVMNYDYSGPWSATTGFLAPLFARIGGNPQQNSIETSMAAYEAAGVPARKLLMGVPFYGYSWKVASAGNNGLFQAGQGVRGDQPYRYIRTLSAPFNAYRDNVSMAPWLFDGQTFWTFEDPTSVRYKVSYALSRRLGGVMIWELGEDSADAELLRAVYRTLHHPLKPRIFDRLRATELAPVASPPAQDTLGEPSSAALTR